THAEGEVEHAIQEQEPERPVEAAEHNLQRIAENRATRPEKLRRQLRGDLTTILVTALRKEPQRRYQIADRFAEDIDRYLSGRPITARKDPFYYRFGKFVGRNKAGVTAGVAILLTLVIAAAVAVYYARQAHLQKQLAIQLADYMLAVPSETTIARKAAFG